MKMHYCLSDDYPGGRIGCLCDRGRDHSEEEFFVTEDEVDASTDVP